MTHNASHGKAWKIFAISALSLVFLVLSASVVISVLYEKTLIRYMKSYLDDHLLTELSMENIRIKFLTGFPKATVEITNAQLLSGKDFNTKDFRATYADTLLKAESILLQFDVLKLLQKQYELRKISVSGGNINILYDRKNRDNLKIWKSSESNSKSYSFNLRNIEVNSSNIRVQYLNKDFNIFAFTPRLNFKGKIDQGKLSGETKGLLKVRQLVSNKKQWSKNSTVQMAINMICGKNHFKISEGTVQVNKAVASVKGEYTGGKSGSIDIELKVPKFGLEELMSLIPDGKRVAAGYYTFNGNGRFNLIVKGPIKDLNHLLIRSDFVLDHCSAKNTKTRESLQDIQLKGSASGTNAENFHLRIDTISARLGKGTINGRFTLSNLKALNFSTRLHSVTDLKALKDFASLDTIESMKGIIRSDLNARGSFRRISDSTILALNYLENGTFEFDDASLKLRNLPINFEKIKGKAIWDRIVRIDSLTMRVNETEFLLEGTIENLANYLLYNHLLKANLKITTDNLDISKYINQPANSNSTSGYKSLSVFPDNIHLKASVYAGNLTGGKFSANHVNLQLSARKDSVFFDKVTMRFPDGSISGTALISIDQNHLFSLKCNARPQKINIQELFAAFNNFSQKFILDRNMKGHLEGTVNFYAKWDSTLKLIPSSLVASGDVQIVNGELLDFAPMLKLSKYIAIDELKHIRFSTLKNTIYISDRVVNIPEMAINSTAFNITISGQHSFDNKFDYRMNVLLSEVLFNKARKKKKEIDDFLVEESADDQTTIPLIVAGTPAEFDVKLDKKKAFRLTGNKLKNNENSVKPPKDDFAVEWEEPVVTTGDQESTDQKEESEMKVEWEE